MASLRIRHWRDFQHYRERRPPWIKLHRSLLENLDYHAASPIACKYLVLLWLLASEHEGELPEPKQLVFRLRVSEAQLVEILGELGWCLEGDASALLADCKRDAVSEKRREETEAEERREQTPRAKALGEPAGFTSFWQAYPRKVAKPAALKAWRAQDCEAVAETILEAVAAQKASGQALGAELKYTPHPSTWLTQRRWTDELVKGGGAPRKVGPAFVSASFEGE